MGDEAPTPRKWTYQQLKAGETILGQQAATHRFASQKGMTGIGMPRWNVTKDHNMGYVEPQREASNVLRPQMGVTWLASQKGETPIGANRNQVAKVVYRESDEEKGPCREGEKVMMKQRGDPHLANQSNSHSHVGKGRSTIEVIYGIGAPNQSCEGINPFQAGTNYFASQAGMSDLPGKNMPRQATKYIEGLDMTEEELRKGTQEIPYFSGSGKFASQKESGGFGKVRDVLPHVKDSNPIDPDIAHRSEGIVRLQSGTNKLASQKGYVFGGPRTQVGKPKFKQEWIDQYEEAAKEWELIRPRFSDSPGGTKQIHEDKGGDEE